MYTWQRATGQSQAIAAVVVAGPVTVVDCSPRLYGVADPSLFDGVAPSVSN